MLDLKRSAKLNLNITNNNTNKKTTTESSK